MASDKEKDIEALNNEEGENQEKEESTFGFYKGLLGQKKYRDENLTNTVKAAAKKLSLHTETASNKVKGSGLEDDQTKNALVDVGQDLKEFADQAKALLQKDAEMCKKKFSTSGNSYNTYNSVQKISDTLGKNFTDKKSPEETANTIKINKIDRYVKDFEKYAGKLKKDAVFSNANDDIVTAAKTLSKLFATVMSAIDKTDEEDKNIAE